jgi:spermidine/putrescine transport system ATP-binding protein
VLELRSVHKSYQGEALLEGISFSVGREETLCLLGPSGSGKSTILQVIAGLEVPESGTVLWDGKDLAATPAHARDFGLVFQDYALFPHLDVHDNVAFGPRMKGWAPAAVRRRVGEVLDLVNLAGFEHRSIGNLSGGEQQRVALARALAPKPRLLMLDEPLGALDRALRQGLLEDLRGLLKRTHVPALYVTHDQEEAFGLADRIALLHAGRIVRQGTPDEIWTRPASPWVATFLGLGTVLNGVVLPQGRLRTDAGTFAAPCRHRHRPGDTVRVLARPEPGGRGALLGGTVTDVIFQPQGYRVVLGNGLFFDSPRAPRRGIRVRVRLPVECLEQGSP